MQLSAVATGRRWLTPALTVLGAAGLAVALWLIPPEQTLGNVIKIIFLHGALAVSYTHLDVYKRQLLRRVLVVENKRS